MKQLKFLLILMTGRKYTVTELSESVEIAERTVWYYIEYLRGFGMHIEVDKKLVQLTGFELNTPLFRDFFEVSDNEVIALKKLFQSADIPADISRSLQSKFGILDEFTAMENIIRQENSEVKTTILEALKTRKQIILHDYESSNSGTVQDRYVEPFEFKNNYEYIMAYDIDKGENKLFKISRVKHVTGLPAIWEYADKHQSLPTDLFRICGMLNKPVKLQLSLLARNLLLEEFPGAACCTKKIDDNIYELETNVAGYQGISRFCMGLPDQVKVLESDELKKYIDARKSTYHSSSGSQGLTY